MRSTYQKDDVVLLLKDITGMVKPQSTEEREKLIQSGKHYCEMLPIEYIPTENYMKAYQNALDQYTGITAQAVGSLSDKIIKQKGEKVVLVSLARAGTPIGILIRRYIKMKYKISVPHYSISIIRGKGIDKNAMNYLLDQYEPGQLLFVDGWTGKGAIFNELKKNTAEYRGVSSEIAVLADPANITDLCGTHEDFLIASSCLNCTVSGLISRTFLRDDIIGKKDFHGAVYYAELENSDLSYEFINTVEKKFVINSVVDSKIIPGDGLEEVKEIAIKYGIDTVNLIKPGIGETTRVLLRRVPWKILIDHKYKDHDELRHVVKLAEEKNVPIKYCSIKHYKCCGIIKKMCDV